jgi:predicted nuclease of predicted toxin-antitoxin system
MRFLANENFPGPVIRALQVAGHDVVWVRLDRPGATDADILNWAARESRVLLTFDKDFGELAGRSIQSPECGVVLVRMRAPKPAEHSNQLAEVIAGRSDWPGHFSVIEPGRIRMRPLR